MEPALLYRPLPLILTACLMGAAPIAEPAQDNASSLPRAESGWCASPPEKVRRMIYDAQGKLRPVIPVRALTQLSACGERGPGSPSASARTAIQNAKYKEMRIQPAQVPKKYRSKEMSAECAVSKEVCVFDAYLDPKVELLFYEKAKKGGLPFAWLFGHAGDAGHYEVSQRAMLEAQRQLGITWAASLVDLIANAAGDPDFYDWATPAAHAQTFSSDETGKVGESQDVARKNFQEWMASYARKAIASCKANEASDAAYYFGYMLHAVQDLAFHEGITNAEHSFLDYNDEAPVDSSNGAAYHTKMKLATLGSTRVIVGFSNYVKTSVPSCWSAWTHGTVSAPSLLRKFKLHGNRVPDLDYGDIRTFRNLGGKVERGMSSRDDARFFARPLWLNGLQEGKLIEIADLIVSSNFSQ